MKAKKFFEIYSLYFFYSLILFDFFIFLANILGVAIGVSFELKSPYSYFKVLMWHGRAC